MKTNQQEQIEALWASVKHWLDNFHHPDSAEISAEFCPLCYLYYDWDNGNKCCIECPVYRKTYQQECKGTPWKQVRQQQDRRRSLLTKANFNSLQDMAIVEHQQKQYLDSIESMYVFLADLALEKSQNFNFGEDNAD